jgi:hypothetical protein
MSDGVDVSVEALRRHAAAVGDLADQVGSAGTSTPTPVGGDAFSPIGSFFTTALMSAADQLREALDTGARSVADVQTGLSAVADVYQRVDDTHAQLLRIVDEGDDATAEQRAGVVQAGLPGPATQAPGG